MRARRTAVLVALAAAAIGAGCGDGDTSAAAGDRLQVVTTVSPITSIAADVIGDLADIRGIVPEGTNSHTFEPTPSDSEVLEGADVVFLNGLRLEEPTLELARQLAGDAEIVRLGDLTVSPEEYRYDESFPEAGGRPNPHLWTDPALSVEYAGHIAHVMSDVDPANAERYEANRAEFATIVDDFDAALRQALDTVPPANRKLVTYHDAYAYWADRYGWEVIAAVQPDDFGDPSPRAVADLVEQIQAERVPAIFGSEVFPSPVLETLATETGARYVADLRDDDLPGEPGDPEHSWLGLMRANYATIVDALGGDASALDQVELRRAATDAAEYPQ